MASYFLSSTDVNRKTTSQLFDYYRCTACGLMFLNPQPDDMRPYYKGGYDPVPKDLSQLRKIARRERYRMDSVLKHKRTGSLLEIGPWIGIFSCNARDMGFDVTAIEMNGECVNFLNRVVGIEAIQSTDPARAMMQLNRQFDVIALWHSLEHLPAPWEVLEQAAKQLAPGGILLVAVPNVESYDFDVLGSSWVHLDCPRHLFFYTAGALEKRCQAAGLETVELSTSDKLSRILSRNAWCHRVGEKLPIKYLRAAIGWALYGIVWRRGHANGSGLTGIFARPV